MSSVLGIVCARQGSKRRPGKNVAKIGGMTLVERAVRTLSEAGLKKIVLATDFLPEFDLVQYNAVHFHRGQNVSGDKVALQETVKWAYYSLEENYEHIVYLMPNCPGISCDCVKQTVELLIGHRYNVVRSYNSDGLENGLIAVRTKYLLDHFIDVYCGGVICEGDEIHDEEDYLKMKKKLEATDG